MSEKTIIRYGGKLCDDSTYESIEYKCKNLLWYIVKMGDDGDSEYCYTLDDVVQTLRAFDVKNLIERYESGVTSEEFQGDNYISLYIGMREDYDYKTAANIRDTEVNIINKKLARLVSTL